MAPAPAPAPSILSHGETEEIPGSQETKKTKEEEESEKRKLLKWH